MDVRIYLEEFLMDKRVIDLPYFLRYPLVHLIAKFRSKSSSRAYHKIWTTEGSPLVVISKKTQKKLQDSLLDIPVALAMRYGDMSIESAMKELYEKGVRELFVIPMYPHYAMSSYETVVVKANELRSKYFSDMALDVMPPFYNDKDYIDVLSKTIDETLSQHEIDYLLFSYHGVPERHINKTHPSKNHIPTLEQKPCKNCHQSKDTCYRYHCFSTTQAVVKNLKIAQNKYSNSFQSRLGYDPWIKPTTSQELLRLAKSGVKHLAIVMPAFVADCLETLEEMGMEGRKTFLNAGGVSFHMVPCLNTTEGWIDVLEKWSKSRFKKHA